MKKVGIITFHHANNFGAALQVYALSRFLERRLGYDVEIIDYRNPFILFTDTVRLFPISPNIEEIRTGLKSFRDRLGRLSRFRKFWRTYYRTGKIYYSSKALRKDPPDCDAYICGSDQIWNPTVTLKLVPAYFLTFVKKGARKLSYAASIGITNVKEKQLGQMRKWLAPFDAVSVREDTGIELLQPGMQQKIEHSIDPTFLLPPGMWEKFAGERIIDGPYILVYVMQNNPEVYEYARKVKEILRIPVVAVSRYGYQADCIDRVMIDLGPREFVNLFRYAEYVCTNSFHGLAFSLIFSRKFFVIPSTRYNSRLENLFRVFGIEPDKEVVDEYVRSERYDPLQVRRIIREERIKAEEYLRGALESDYDRYQK